MTQAPRPYTPSWPAALLAGLLLAPLLSAAPDAGVDGDSTGRVPTFRSGTAQQDRPRVSAARAAREGDIRQLFADAGLDYPPAEALLRVFKAVDVLELWVRPVRARAFVHLKDYAVCMRSGTVGPKRQRGDLQVPEGLYRVIAFNPTSDFHLAMLIDYPNDSDRRRKTGRDAGGSICIHGNCVTIGCLPLTDRWIEELYLICLDTARAGGRPVRVHVFPDRLDDAGLARLERAHADKPGWLTLWRELKVAHDRFEADHTLPRYWIDEKGAHRFPKVAPKP